MSAVRPILEGIGLNPKEIEIYILLLQTGGSSASALARRMKIPTSTAQYTCQQLLKKGLIRMIQKGNMYLFGAQSPRHLMELMKRQEEELETKRSSLERIIEELEGMANPDSVLPKVKFFEGRDGIIEAYNEVLHDLVEGDEAIVYVTPIDLSVDRLKLKSLYDRIYDEFVQKKVRTRVIMPVSKDNLERHAEEEKYLETIRLVSADTFKCSPTEIILYKDKMYCMTSEHDMIFATILQNAAIVEMHRAIFEMAWASAKDTHEKVKSAAKKAK